MSGICDGDWQKSKINGQPETPGGTNFIHVDDDQGAITGKHMDTNQDIFGICIERENMHMSFTRFERQCFYQYDGDITQHNNGGVVTLLITGKRTKICPGNRGMIVLAIPDDWTAEKPT